MVAAGILLSYLTGCRMVTVFDTRVKIGDDCVMVEREADTSDNDEDIRAAEYFCSAIVTPHSGLWAPADLWTSFVHHHVDSWPRSGGYDATDLNQLEKRNEAASDYVTASFARLSQILPEYYNYIAIPYSYCQTK
jgi:hypothetical protein